MSNEKKFYLTNEGLKRIKKEYQKAKQSRLNKSRAGVPSILHSEDLNPEYISFQEDVTFLDNRINEFKNILKNVKIIKKPFKSGQSFVDLGASVLIETEDGQTDEFKIVGSLEANPSLGMISNESPVGKALLGHKERDEVIVESGMKIAYKIKKINYKKL